MVSSASSRDDSQERKSFLDKPNSSKTTKSVADASGKSGKTEKSTEKSIKRSESAKSSKNAKSAKSEKSAKTTMQSERTGKSLTSQKSFASIKSVGRRGPKMSDGTEYDTGPYGYIFSFIFLFVLWGLAILAAIALIYFNYSRLDPQYPSYFGEGSFLGSVPKATFDPNPRRFQEEATKNLMKWNIYDFDSYVNFLIRYKQVLKGYAAEEKPSKNLCKNKKMTDKEACGFDRITGFGDCVLSSDNLEHGFGFSKGQPCIMLKLNKILGWVPKFKNATKCPKDNLCCGPGIQFKCKSNGGAHFEYYPKNGIPACYFPYANQKGYEQPYQMIKVSNLTFNKETTIECSPTNDFLNKINDEKENEARFHILMKHESVGGSE